MSRSPHSHFPQSRGTPSRVRELITDPETKIGAFYNHAKVLARLDSLLSEYSDPAVASMFQVANLRQGRLILITPSASFATRLRLHNNAMLDFLHESGYHQVSDIEIHIAPLQHEKPENKTRRLASPAAQEAADLITRLTVPPKS